MSASEFVDVVVTGASGFIGKAVCRELSRRNARILAVSRHRELNAAALEPWKVIGYDELEGFRHAACVHLAGNSSRSAAAQYFEDAMTEATQLAEKIAGVRFRRVVYASSAVVYGDKVDRPRNEQEQASPEEPYAKIKHASERMFLGEGNVVARLSNVYGPGMAAKNVVSHVIGQARAAVIHVHDEFPVRDFIHVNDVARGLASLALGDLTGVFNIGTGVGRSVRDLALLIARVAEEESPRVVSEVKESHRSVVVLDPSKMKNTFDWSAEIPLQKGLASLVSKIVGRVDSTP